MFQNFGKGYNFQSSDNADQTGSYAITMLHQSFVCSETAFSWDWTTSMVLLLSRCFAFVSPKTLLSADGAAYLQSLPHAKDNLQAAG